MTEDADANKTALPRTISGSLVDRVMDQHLIPWALYDLSGARSPDSLETMQDYFRRFRGLRGKRLDGISYESLQRSWCAFIRRWNRMHEDGRNFQQWLVNREDIHADHSIGVLREKICENAWNVDRLCYVHVHESCYSCDSVPRPTREAWKRHVAEYPLSDYEQLWIGRYERSLVERKTAVNRGASRWRHHSRSRGRGAVQSPRRSRSRDRRDTRSSQRSRRRSSSCRRGETSPRRSRNRSRSRSRGDTSPRHRHRASRSRSPREHTGRRPSLHQACAGTRKHERGPERLEEAKSAVPTYPARVETRANVHDTCARLEPRAHGVATMSFRDEGPRDPVNAPQSSASGLPRPQAVVDPHDGTAGVLVAQDDVDAAVNKAVDAQLEAEAALDRAARAERTANEIRQSNRELLERMRNLERQVLGHAQAGTQPRPMSLARRARREGRSTYEPLTPRTEPTREA